MADLKAQLEIGADVSGVEAGISKAKRSINSLGVAVQESNSRASKSIDRYVQSLNVQAATMGKSANEAELYKLALKGASDAQLKAAATAQQSIDAQVRMRDNIATLKAGFVAFAAFAATGLIAAAAAFDDLLKRAGNFQDMSEKFGDTAENFASMAVAAGTAGVQMDQVGAAAAKLTHNLVGVDDESKAAGAAITALGLDLAKFKQLAPADQMETVAKALANFEDGASKTAVAMALFGKAGADLLPFLKELGQEGGRQAILTAEQIKLADEYADRQAKLRSQIGLHAQSIATQLLPQVNDLMQAFADLAGDQTVAATAADILKAAFGGAVKVFQTIAVIASDVGFVFLGIGREIGAIAAQLAALARLDFAGFTAISDAVREDALRARAELDKFQGRILSIGATPETRDPDLDREVARAARAAARGRAKLKFNGATDEKKLAAEANAALKLDLENIKAGAQALTETFANAEKIMQAQRSAGLLSEREYYDSKLGFIRLNAQAQEQALQAEIARREQEKLVGKDKIDNEREVVKLRAQLAKVQAAASAETAVLDVQEASAMRQRESALKSARQAAQDYYDTINTQQARELAAIGKGAKTRNLNAGLNQIEDRYADQRRDLENQRALLELEGKFNAEARKQYQERLAIIDEFQEKSTKSYIEYYASLMEQQGNWMAGAGEALQNYFDDTQNIFKDTENLVSNAFQGMEDALVDFVRTGKLNVTSLVNSMIADFARIAIRQSITGPLANMFLGALGGGSGPIPSANGNVFQSAGLSAYSNQIVSSPTLFAFARGAGLMGEAGPEAIMPLSRGKDGRLGVEVSGGGGPVINMTVNATVGDIASKSDVVAGMQAVKGQIIGALSRSRQYGGATA